MTEGSDPADAWDGPILHLDGFDGPMDLLLDLAERQRVDFGRISVLDLAEQFTAAMDSLAGQVALARRADWLVLATRLVLLRSRLLFPASPQAAADAEAEAAREIQCLDERIAMRAAGAWLGRRPQLGIETFVRPHAERPRQGGYVALMEACLVVLRSGGQRMEAEAVHAHTIPDLWRVADALNHMSELLTQYPQGGDLAAFLPTLRQSDPNLDERARTALASTVVAALELARCTELGLRQEAPFGPIRIYPVSP